MSSKLFSKLVAFIFCPLNASSSVAASPPRKTVEVWRCPVAAVVHHFIRSRKCYRNFKKKKTNEINTLKSVKNKSEKKTPQEIPTANPNNTTRQVPKNKHVCVYESSSL